MTDPTPLDVSAEPAPDYRLVMVTGPSGAGRSTAVHALEDLGYEAIDNLPLRLVPRLTEGTPTGRPVALGLDIRNRDFNMAALLELIDGLARNPRVGLEVLYLDCAPGELVRRYSQTRRRHPLDYATPGEGIDREIDLLAPVRARADHLIDTTDFTPHDLTAEIGRWFSLDRAARMAVSVQSFSYRRGVPRGVDFVFDCRFLRNPHWVPALKPLDGRDPQVAAYVEGDPRFAEFFQKVSELMLMLLPASLEEGKSYLSIGFGCTGGQHRSVAVAEKLGKVLAEAGWPVSKRHRELERRAAQGLPHGIGVTGA
ncbi:MAG: RNase adapter RapZ [Paracoccaceae bacterium]